MNQFKIGDIVARKSYGGDTYFRIVGIVANQPDHPVYMLKGLLHRLEADSTGEDLLVQDPQLVNKAITQHVLTAKRQAFRGGLYNRMNRFNRSRYKMGTILHIDSSEDFMKTCLSHYSGENITAVGKCISEREQPAYVRGLLERNNPDILVITGHDSMKKNAVNPLSMDNYSNSRYYVQSVKEARRYEPSLDKLCIFAGACQSCFETIMGAGANFASSPGRVLINALDPAIVSEKVAMTDNRAMVFPQEVSRLTVSGSKGIGGIKTRGHMITQA